MIVKEKQYATKEGPANKLVLRSNVGSDRNIIYSLYKPELTLSKP